MADPASVDALADALSDVEVSILINNAGIGGPVAPLIEIDVEAWDEVFDVNVRGVFLHVPRVPAGHGRARGR